MSFVYIECKFSVFLADTEVFFLAEVCMTKFLASGIRYDALLAGEQDSREIGVVASEKEINSPR